MSSADAADDILSGAEVRRRRRRHPRVTCNIEAWFANVPPPRAQSEFAPTASASARKGCDQYSSGSPTSDHRSSRCRRTSSQPLLRPAVPTPTIRRSSTPSATGREAK